MENIRPNRATLDHHQAKREAIESWDDDGDFLDLRQLRSLDPLDSHYSDRDSLSGRHPGKSNTPVSFYEGDQQQEIVLPSDVESSNAIRSALNAGIPLPSNVPLSALLGGTIRRLGTTRKIKQRLVTDDWTDELVLPALGEPFTVKRVDSHEFPQVLSDDMRYSPRPGRSRSPKSNDEMDGDEVPTVRAPRKVRTKPSLKDAFVPPGGQPQRNIPPIPAAQEDDIEKDFSLPDTQDELKLVSKYVDRRSQSPAVTHGDSDVEDWGEGSSLGTRHGGTRRARSSSIASALSSSMSSSITMESEDEGLDGLEFPEGDLNFKKILERKRQMSLETAAHDSLPRKMMSEEDFFNDLDVQDGRVFSRIPSSKNIKRKPSEPKSPIRRTSVALTFTKKATIQPIPRPRRLSNTSVTHLETVAESSPRTEDPKIASAALASSSKTKLAAPPANSKNNSLAAPESEPVKSLRSQKSTPNLRSGGSLATKLRQPLPPPGSTSSRPNASTPITSKPRLGTDTSLVLQPARPPSRSNLGRPPSRTERYNRPPSREQISQRPSSRNHINRPTSRTSSRPSSRNEYISRSRSPRRPFTPSERSPSRGPHGNKGVVPFLPAGSSVQQSHHINAKLNRQPSRPSLHSNALQEDRSNSRASQHRKASPSPVRNPQSSLAPDSLRKEAVATNTLRAPTRRRNFGDGNELLGFDDLPTNSVAEKKFVVQPSGRGAPKTLRTKKLPVIASLSVQTPHFARETTASRIAREQNMDHTRQQRRPAVSRGRKKAHQHQAKPHLIKPLGSNQQLKEVKGMVYNPMTYCWEGNDADVQSFERRDQLPTTPPRPALIASVNSPKNIKVVGGMVFDPSHMCWLKVSDHGSDDEADPFAGIDDLEETMSLNAYGSGDGSGSVGGNMIDYPLSEEFDVGPEFVRRQREEEERWKTKVKGWISENEDIREARFWDIKNIAMGDYRR